MKSRDDFLLESLFSGVLDMNQTLCKNSLVKLSPPSVPQACRHGIGVRTASSLTVHIDPYDSMDDGDLIELF